jgi:hypothetical protein
MEVVAGCTAFCDGALCEGAAARGASSPAQLQLPAGALTACSLSAGERVLVAVVQPPENGTAPSSAASPLSSRGASPGTPAPPRTPPTGARGVPRRLEVPADAAPLRLLPSAADRSAHDGGDGAAADPAAAARERPAALPPPGEYLLAACVWPSQKLATGAASATAALLDAAGGPQPGSVLRAYALAAPGSSAAASRVPALVADCEHLTLTLCEPADAAPPDATTLQQPPSAPATPMTPVPARAPRSSGSASRAGTPAESPARVAPTVAARAKAAAARCGS